MVDLFLSVAHLSSVEQKVQESAQLPENQRQRKKINLPRQPGPGRGKRKEKGTPQARGWKTRKRRKAAETRLDSSPTFLVAHVEAILEHSPTKTRAQYRTQLKLQVTIENDPNYSLECHQGEPVLLGMVSR